MDGAVAEFERLASIWRTLPAQYPLLRRFIESEDVVRLQAVMDSSVKAQGESSSLFDLMLALLECGRIQQAKKIVEVKLVNIFFRIFQ